MREAARLLLSALLLSSPSTVAQDAGVVAPDSVLLRAGQLVDVKAGKVLTDQGILVSGERIVAVGSWDSLRSRPAAGPTRTRRRR